MLNELYKLIGYSKLEIYQLELLQCLTGEDLSEEILSKKFIKLFRKIILTHDKDKIFMFISSQDNIDKLRQKLTTNFSELVRVNNKEKVVVKSNTIMLLTYERLKNGVCGINPDKIILFDLELTPEQFKEFYMGIYPLTCSQKVKNIRFNPLEII